MLYQFRLSQLFLFVVISFGFSACADLDEVGDSLANHNDSKGVSIRTTSTPFVSGEGYPWYRTPSLIKADNGDLLAFAGARDARSDDSRSDVVLRRSKDAGKTWLPIQTIAGKMKNRNGLPNPVTLNNGEIILLYMWSKYTTEHQHRGCRKMYKVTSTDHGKTWSSRVEITSQTQLPCEEDEHGHVISPPASGKWGWTGLGPVHGIVKRHKPNRGRRYGS